MARKKNVVIIHYHLNPGGVTRIIESQIAALELRNEISSIKVICGKAPDDFRAGNAEIITDEKFNYLIPNLSKRELADRLKKMYKLLSEHINASDIVHVHNLNLGKNPLLTLALYEMALEKYHILNHAHDFAEDRLENWLFLQKVIQNGFGIDLDAVMYPELPNYRYAVLTSCDRERLIKYAIAEDSLDVLPNPVNLERSQGDPVEDNEELRRTFELDAGKKIIVYPVRGIRRKNVGELVLLAAALGDRAQFLITLPPKNPIEQVDYERWKGFCRKNHVNVIFEAGEKMPFAKILNGCDKCITTSVKEGFGMAFLEPWLFGKSVCGRRLPGVCTDLDQSGIRFNGLYESLNVEFEGAKVDFPNLTCEGQMKVITQLQSSPEKTHAFISKNHLAQKILVDEIPETITANRNCIKNNYSLEKYGESLVEIYKKFS